MPQNSMRSFLSVEKYGVIPKKCFPESHSSEASRRMNDILNHKVRRFVWFSCFVLFCFFSSSHYPQFHPAQVRSGAGDSLTLSLLSSLLFLLCFLVCGFLCQLREYCLRLRNMVASEASKAELSEAMDTMLEEVRAQGHKVTRSRSSSTPDSLLSLDRIR